MELDTVTTPDTVAAASATRPGRGRELGKRLKREGWRDAASTSPDKTVERRVKAKASRAEPQILGTSARKQAGHSSDDEDGHDDKAPTPKSRFYGVHWNRRKRKWRVRIKANGRDTHVGYFNDEEAAAHAYDRAVMTHNRDWTRDSSVRLNFPGQVADVPLATSPADSAICMILAASQSPGRASDMVTETPPPTATVEAGMTTMASPLRSTTGSRAPSSPYRTPTSAGRMLPPVNTELVEAFGGAPLTPSPPTLVAEDSSGKAFGSGSSQGGASSLDDRSPSALSVLSSRSTPAQADKPSAYKAVSATPPKMIPFPLADLGSATIQSGEAFTGLPPPGGSLREVSVVRPSRWVPGQPHGAFQQHVAAKDEGLVKQEATHALCHEGELEALKGLMELVGACHYEAERNSPPAVPSRGRRESAGQKRKSTGERRGASRGRSVELVETAASESTSSAEGGAGGPQPLARRNQSFRGVTWDKMKKMWRVRVCLAGGGREHVGYFLNEKEGALAYTKALARIKQVGSGSQDEDATEEDGAEIDGRVAVAV